MARTRSKPGPQATEASPSTTTKSLPLTSTNPPKLFVLPENITKDAHVVTINNPATGVPSRYLFCPQQGFHEFTRFAAPQKDCRSWLITGDDDSPDDVADDMAEMRIGSGYVTSSNDLFIATPIDALFLLLPVLAPQSAKDTKQHFLALDDYLDMLASSSPHWRVLLAQYPSLGEMLETKLRRVCDTVEAGEDSMYRISSAKLANILYRKAECMVENGLPPSLEEKFVTSALQVPIMSVQRDAAADDTSDAIVPDNSLSTASNSTFTVTVPATSTAATTVAAETTIADTTTTDTTATDSTATEATATDSTATEATTTDTVVTPPSIPPLLRLRTSLTYLTKSYLPPILHPVLEPHFAPHFTLLTAHLAHLASLRAQATALRSLSDNITRKRAANLFDNDEDDERAAAREAKQRKREEEEKKTKAQGRALKQLSKVDTSGMRKMSSFFTKVAKDKGGE